MWAIVALVSVGLAAAVLILIWISRKHAQHDRAQQAAAREQQVSDWKAEWARDHDVYTGLPRLHSFRKLAGELLERARADEQPHQLVAVKLAELRLTTQALGHDAAIKQMQQLSEFLRAKPFPALGQSRDICFIFAPKAQIDSELKGEGSWTDTLVLRPSPRLFAGTATWPNDGAGIDELMRRAEAALSHAEEQREPWIDFQPSMESDPEDLRLLSLFQETKASGLRPVFQPQIDLNKDRIFGAEALARWQPPGSETLMPVSFIPLLENAGLIRHLTSRMIAEGSRVAANLRRAGLFCPISVNVAISDLLGEKTRRSIFDSIRKHRGQPGDLKLELTETGVAEHPDVLSWVLTRLRDSGIPISIDDFGTAYSSLSYLSEFPIHEVKIDRTFVANMKSKAQDRSIVRSTIAMAHELGIKVVAEGVEDEATLEMLTKDGCDAAQGFLFCEPLPEQDFLRYVEETKTTGCTAKLRRLPVRGA